MSGPIPRRSLLRQPGQKSTEAEPLLLEGYQGMVVGRHAWAHRTGTT
jgi:hypothetical protein